MVRDERLSAEPIQHIVVNGGEGWLYLWNNGDTQMFWLRRPRSSSSTGQYDEENAKEPH